MAYLKLSLIGLLILGMAGLCPAEIDPRYHTNEEILDSLLHWQQEYPDIVLVDTIGYSQQDTLPIWSIKLSDNVQLDEDEPTVLFVGQVHAEELIGIEITLTMVADILTHRYQTSPYGYAAWLQLLEIWVIPTANPEGHQVVMDEWDPSFRKNKRDCNLNGFFDYNPGAGGDIDGVDINRNFPLNWVHGDTFLQPGGNEVYDYFRGFSPISESETQVLWDLGLQEKFSFSIVWHSSRTGNYSEKVFYPWDWGGSGKRPPDFEVIDSTGALLAGRIHKYNSGSTYMPSPTDTPAGNQHDSFYAYLGTISFLIEAGPSIQSPYEIAEQVIEENKKGAYFILDRASPGWNDSLNNAQLTGVVTDADNPAQKLPATVTVAQLSGPYQAPRTCDPTYGRYRRYVLPGGYDVEARLRGYYPQSVHVTANASGPEIHNFALVPKPHYSFNGQVLNLTGGPLACMLFILGEDVADTISIPPDGSFSTELPEGDYQLIFDCPGYVIRHDTLNLDQNLYIEFKLSPDTSLFFDDFEGGLAQWTTGGSYIRWGTEPADSLWPGGMVATESPNGAYLPISDNWIELAVPLDLSDYATAALRFQHWYYFEPGYDYGLVEVSADGGSGWDPVAGPYDGQDIGWGTAYGNLDPYCGLDNVTLRWRITTDETLNEQGWRIDDVEIMASDTFFYAPPIAELPCTFALYSVYPNPFNSQLAILLDLPREQFTEVALWDIAGRLVAEIYNGQLTPGRNRLSWQAQSDLPSGIYLLRISGRAGTEIRKVLHLK